MSQIRKIGPMTSGVATGGAGVATANTTSSMLVNGLLIGFAITYLDSPPAGTTDVTVATAGTKDSHPAKNLIVITNGATDGFYPVLAQVYGTDGAAISGQYTNIPVDDYFKVTIAGANDDDYALVWAWVVG